MKIMTLKPFLQNVLAVWLVAALAGCATDNYKKGDRTASDLMDAANSIATGQTKIDTVLSSLSELVNNPQGDLSGDFKKFTAAVKSLESTAADVRKQVEGMRKDGNTYFQRWDQQLAAIQNEDIKNRSAARRAEMQQKFIEVKSGYTEAKQAFDPFMQDLKDIQIALSTDLTAGGLAAIKDVTDKTTRDGHTLQDSAQKLVNHFRNLGVELSATAPAP
ncbi:MAG: DUF2959 family protein [Verrucomicrobiae bacterium]|nr:DUF2959 family protein [Verrucomicrobiae bacterium]